jgi:hypothetical protein
MLQYQTTRSLYQSLKQLRESDLPQDLVDKAIDSIVIRNQIVHGNIR